MAEHNDFGNLAEDLAADYLTQKNYKILVRNFRYQKAEIDIVTEFEDLIVVVEVKARSYDTLIEPQEAVTKKKIKSIVLCTDFFMRERNLDKEVRFDIITVLPDQSGKLQINQQIEKGFSMYIYDFKFDDLSTIAYNHLLKHTDRYTVKPKFYVINFDDPRKSHRCNPINPDFMTDISDAYESAYTIMLNLNKSWILKQGDFFVESPIILLAAIIWYLKIYENGKYCTFPHAIELLKRTSKN